MSQFDLALQSGFSARHLSFIETGRTQPSRSVLLVLAETLGIPLRERNHLLEAGGYARVYRQTPLAAEEMRHIRGMVEFILERHQPYGAVALDRYSNILMANSAATNLLASFVDPSLLDGQPNVFRAVFHPLGARRWIVNWEEAGRHLLDSAERDLGNFRDDEDAARLLAELRGYAGGMVSATRVPPRGAGLLLPFHLRREDLEVRIFSAIMTLGTPQDVTLQELRIETFFPADARSEERLRTLGASH